MKKMQGRSVVQGSGPWPGAWPPSCGIPGCADVPQLAPPESTIVLIANPPFIPANGGVSVISAVVTEAVGTPVPDGTVVQFFTTSATSTAKG